MVAAIALDAAAAGAAAGTASVGVTVGAAAAERLFVAQGNGEWGVWVPWRVQGTAEAEVAGAAELAPPLACAHLRVAQTGAN